MLAIKLVDESREPNHYEKFKLRLMRFGNRLINGKQLAESPVEAGDL